MFTPSKRTITFLLFVFIGVSCTNKKSVLDDKTTKNLRTYVSEQLNKTEQGTIIDTFRINNIDTVTDKLIANYVYQTLYHRLFENARHLKNDSDVDSVRIYLDNLESDFLNRYDASKPVAYGVSIYIVYHRKDMSVQKEDMDTFLSLNKEILRSEEVLEPFVRDNHLMENLILIREKYFKP